MFLFHKPSDKEIRDFIAAQSKLSFSYKEVGETKSGAAPAGYPINQIRAELGKGAETFAKGTEALFSWQMYATDWTELHPRGAPVREGETVAVLAKHFGFWSLNPCRIIYTIEEETAQVRRNGFAFGTLPAHSETGEERFTVEFDKTGGAVAYQLYAFARPHNLAAKIGSPLVRLLQKRFAADSGEAMLKAVS